MEGVFIAIIVLGLLMVFGSNRFIKPIAYYIFWIIRGAISIFIGVVFGAIVGYYWFSSLPVGSMEVDISDNTNAVGHLYHHVFLSALLGNEARVDGVELGPIRDKIILCIIIGALIGLIIFIRNTVKAAKRRWKALRMCDEVIRLTELKYEKKISEEEYEKRKEEVLNS